MASTSCNERAGEALALCLRGGRPPAAEVRALAEECPDALFRVVVEGLADRFEPALCELYADLMADAIGTDPARYRRIRRPRPCALEPATVFVLSRVTLGADVAVTSVLLDAVKRRFPRAAVLLAGERKNWELFAADPRIGHLPVGYRRGAMAERLAAPEELRRACAVPDSIVVDSDSRLTQLGLVPVCPEENYFFFESRAYGGSDDAALPELARRWAAEVFGVADARAYVALAGTAETADVALSLGVGENPAKRLPDPFEANLLRVLAARGESIWIDRGAGGAEARRVERAIAESGVPRERIRTWEGSFAGFASIIARSRLYAGYDSAGQHVAAACGVPLISIFAGFPCPRMFQRWRPAGTVIRVDHPDPARVLDQVATAVQTARGVHG